MRVPVPDVFGVRQQQVFIYFNGVLGRLGKTHQPVFDRRLGILFYQPVGRIEGSRGTLGNIGDTPAADGFFYLGSCPDQFGAVKNDRSRSNPATLAGVAHGGHPDGRFAGAGFPDQAQNFTALKG